MMKLGVSSFGLKSPIGAQRQVAGRQRIVIRCSQAQTRVIRDDDKEQSRKYRRTVMNFETWAKFRSTSRYYFAIKTIPSSRIVRALFPAILWVAGFSYFVGAYETALKDGLLPSYLPDLTLSNPSPQGLTSFALALLLVFRTNVSHARFLDARKMWGLLLNRGRDFQRQTLSYFPPNSDDTYNFSARWVSAWGFSLMCHLRDDHILEEEVKGILEPQEVADLIKSPHAPLFCLQMLSTMVQTSETTQIDKLQMHQNLTTFEDILGGCERILSTPVPLSYTRHTARFLLIWLTFLPFGLWNTLGWATIPADALIAALLLGIEEIGVQIEEPFGILALEAICAKLNKNVFDLNQEHDTCLGLWRNDNSSTKWQGMGMTQEML